MTRKSSFDRRDLFGVPTYKEIIGKIVDTPIRKTFYWRKAATATLVATGCRVGELIKILKKHIKFYGINGIELSGNFKEEDIYMIHFFMYTEKNRKTKHRIVPLIRNELFTPLFPIIYTHWKNTEGPDTPLFGKKRETVWHAIKAVLGINYYPHYLRHTGVTNDTRAGMNAMVIRNKYGWTDLRQHSTYSHLNVNDTEREMKRAYGSDQDKILSEIAQRTSSPLQPDIHTTDKEQEKKQIKTLVDSAIKAEIRRLSKEEGKTSSTIIQQQRGVLENTMSKNPANAITIDLAARLQEERNSGPSISILESEPVRVKSERERLSEVNLNNRILREKTYDAKRPLKYIIKNKSNKIMESREISVV